MRLIAIKARPADRIDRSFCVPGTGDPEGVLPDAVLGITDLPEAASVADALVLTLPKTAETIGIVGREVLRALPRTAWVVNVARGAVVDGEELVRLLEGGHIGGAVLDVFDPEPLPESSPLWRLPNVIATPHVAGGGPASRELFALLVVENLRRFADGRPLMNAVDGGARY
jgi:phosphoglycerate dehydrogenase-like enzyme